MRLVFTARSRAQYQKWVSGEADGLRRANELIKDAMRSPSSGIGKPEPLVGTLKGWWSRRIDREHRLVYRVSSHVPDQSLEILACRLHCD